jgi:glycosyltransferase involved in cell wall biosynthesis
VLADGVDVVHVAPDDLAGIAPFLDGRPAVLAPFDARHRNIRTQADQASGLTRVWREHQYRAVRRYLTAALRPYGAAVFVTGEDAAEAGRLDPQARPCVIPLAVDAASFAPPPDLGPRDPTQVLFTGVLGAPANEHAARRLAVDIMPLVRAEVPGARLTLVGRAPSAAVLGLRGPAVEVVADAPDLRPWLWGTGAFACPMAHGTGSKNKLLEALAAGAAAVATPLACRGLAGRDGEHLLVAGTDRELAAGLVAVLRDDGRRASLAAAARALVAADHAPGVIAARYVSLYGDVIAR